MTKVCGSGRCLGGDGGYVLFADHEVIIVGPTHDVGVHFGKLVLHLRVDGNAFNTVNDEWLQHGRVANAMVSAKGRECSTHAFCPIARPECPARLRFAFDNDFFHFIIITIRPMGVAMRKATGIMDTLNTRMCFGLSTL